MTSTLILTANIVLGVALIGLLAYAMSHPRKLTPHEPSVVPERPTAHVPLNWRT